jgi:predicted small metal-binding protein
LTQARRREEDRADKEVHDMARVMADCRRWPSETDCSLTIIGEEEEVVRAAAEHAASVHGHEDTPEMREQLRDFLEPAEAYSNEARQHEPLPG